MGAEITVVFRDDRPVLWQGELVCSHCEHRCAVEVLGRRGHDYPFGDEVTDADAGAEADASSAPPDGGAQANETGAADAAADADPEGHIREDYSSEAMGVLAFVRCPKCGKRDPVRVRGELGRVGRWLFAAVVLTGGIAAYLMRSDYPLHGRALLGLAAIVVVGRLALVLVTAREAADRAHFPGPDELGER